MADYIKRKDAERHACVLLYVYGKDSLPDDEVPGLVQFFSISTHLPMLPL